MYDDLKKQFVEVFHLPKKFRDILPRNPELSFAETILLTQISHQLDDRKDAEVCVSDLKPFMGVTNPAISQALNVLEAKGHIVRKIAAGDRRSIALEITPNGQRVLDDNRNRMSAFLEELISRFGPENTKQLVDLFDQMTRIALEIKQSHQTEERTPPT